MMRTSKPNINIRKSILEIKKVYILDSYILESMFQDTIIKEAKKANKKIVFPESLEERTLKAIEKIIKQKIAIPVLIGEEKEIFDKIKSLNLNIKSKDIIIYSLNDPNINYYANELFKARKKKGLTIEEAKELLKEPIYLGTMLLRLRKVDGLVSGAIHTTAHTLRPAFQLIKTDNKIKKASSVFFMVKKEKVFLFADCAVQVNPSSEELADIALSTAETARKFSIKPKVALLSYSTMGSGQGESQEKVKKATLIAKKKNKHLSLDGEMQVDAALDKFTAKLKCKNSKIKGDANCLIFPSLDAGNIGYKLVERLAGYSAIGPIIQGLSSPVNDLSRGCSSEDIFFVAAITAIQSKK